MAFAGHAFHATGVYVWGNAGESSCLCHSPGTIFSRWQASFVACLCQVTFVLCWNKGIFVSVLGFFLGSPQNFCSKSVPIWPPQSALKLHLGPLGQSCADVCQRSSHVCEPALFHHLNDPAAFSRWQIRKNRWWSGNSEFKLLPWLVFDHSLLLN